MKRIVRSEIVPNVFRYALLEGGERPVIAGRSQPVHARLREVLVFPAQGLRHVDELDSAWLPGRVEQSMRKVQPCTSLSRAQVEPAGYLVVVHKPKKDVDTILHVDEVAKLSAIRIVRPITSVEAHR